MATTLIDMKFRWHAAIAAIAPALLPSSAVRACCSACGSQPASSSWCCRARSWDLQICCLISAHHGLGGLSPAWIQAHGHSQVFGWIGSFVLGIGFYSQPLTRANRGRLPLMCWSLWAAGLTLHWLAGAYLWQWRVTLPLSGAAGAGGDPAVPLCGQPAQAARARRRESRAAGEDDASSRGCRRYW